MVQCNASVIHTNIFQTPSRLVQCCLLSRNFVFTYKNFPNQNNSFLYRHFTSKKWIFVIAIMASSSVLVIDTFLQKMRLTHTYCKDFGNSFSGSCYADTGKKSPKEMRESPNPSIFHVTDWYIKKKKPTDALYLTF